MPRFWVRGSWGEVGIETTKGTKRMKLVGFIVPPRGQLPQADMLSGRESRDTDDGELN